MTNRQPVHSPFEVNGGDRIELLDEDDRGKSALMDLLFRDGMIWSGRLVSVSPRSQDSEGWPMRAGDRGFIHADAYAKGCVFIHRRSREGSLRDQACEVSRG